MMIKWLKNKIAKKQKWKWHTDPRVKFMGHIEITVDGCAPLIVHSHDFVQFLNGVTETNEAFRSVGHDRIVELDRQAQAFIRSVYGEHTEQSEPTVPASTSIH